MFLVFKLVVFRVIGVSVDAFLSIATGFLLSWWSLTGWTSFISRSIEIGVCGRLLSRRCLNAMKLCRRRIRKKVCSQSGSILPGYKVWFRWLERCSLGVGRG